MAGDAVVPGRILMTDTPTSGRLPRLDVDFSSPTPELVRDPYAVYEQIRALGELKRARKPAARPRRRPRRPAAD